MLSAHAEFARRVAEVDEYLKHLESLELNTGFPVSLMNTMKSSALLMLYNVIESTMTNLLQDVFDHLHAKNVAFDTLNKKMKTLVLSYSKRRNPATLVEKMDNSSMSLVVACFDRTEVFSGNLDCKKIRDTLKDVGVSSKHNYTESALLVVKKERNELAHGNKSFSDCGKNYSAKQLRDFHNKSLVILERVIADFEGFLNSGEYT